MAVDYGVLMARRQENILHTYDERDSLLYAVSIGMGRDPLDRQELEYVFEKHGPRTVPAQAITLTDHDLIWNIGLDVGSFLHGEQLMTFHRPLPPAGELSADAWVSEVYDKGAEKGCIIEMKGSVRTRTDGEPLFDWTSRIFARRDGGCGGSTARVPAPHPMPERAPDLIRTSETRPDQALLYRLNGDRNLQHVDPDLAISVGFPRPILHGACTSAIACREVLAGACDYDHTRVRAFDVRYTTVVYPGETIETAIWIDGDTVSFRCRVVERDVVVIDHGRCIISD